MAIFKGKIRQRNSGGTYDYLLPETTIDMVNGLQSELDNKVSELELEYRLKEIANHTKGYINLASIIGDDEYTDISTILNQTIEYCLNTLWDSSTQTIYPKGYIDKIIIPSGNYDVRSTIITYPQIKLVSEGYVQFNSYLSTGSVFYLKYPVHMSQLECDYRGNPISGLSDGIHIINALYSGVTITNGDVFGGDAVAIELGSRVADDPIFSDIRMVSRYGIDNILISGFKTGIKLNGISHFFGDYGKLRIKLCDTCVQVGEFQGQSLDTSIENFKFHNCLFERSEHVIKWIRNGVGLSFNDCSFDFIRSDMMLATVSGTRRINFINGHIEKVSGDLFKATYTTTFNSINTIINFKGVQMHLKHSELFSLLNGVMMVVIDDCVYLRDEYYTDTNISKFDATKHVPMGDDKVLFDIKNLIILENDGVPVIGTHYDSNVEYAFKSSEITDLKTKSNDYLKGYTFSHSGASTTGIVSLVEVTNNDIKSAWNMDKQIRFKLSNTSTFGYFELITDKIKALTNLFTVTNIVKSNDYNNTSIILTINAYNSNNEVIYNTTFTRSSGTSEWGTLPVNAYNKFSAHKNLGAIVLPKTTEYIRLTTRLSSTNPNSNFEFSGSMINFI